MIRVTAKKRCQASSASEFCSRTRLSRVPTSRWSSLDLAETHNAGNLGNTARAQGRPAPCGRPGDSGDRCTFGRIGSARRLPSARDAELRRGEEPRRPFRSHGPAAFIETNVVGHVFFSPIRLLRRDARVLGRAAGRRTERAAFSRPLHESTERCLRPRSARRTPRSRNHATPYAGAEQRRRRVRGDRLGGCWVRMHLVACCGLCFCRLRRMPTLTSDVLSSIGCILRPRLACFVSLRERESADDRGNCA
jgi:hypothetical protein